jgi:hypothetical protein
VRANASEELVIPDFGEVPISLDSSRGRNNQHKSASASVAAAKGRTTGGTTAPGGEFEK